MTADDFPAGGFVAAVAGLPAMTPHRLRLLLHHHGPREAYDVACGRVRPAPMVARSMSDTRGDRVSDVRDTWARHAPERHPGVCWQACVDADVRVILPGDAEFPAELRVDPFPPAALFVRGDLGALDARRVGVVGTRNATRQGLETAVALGVDLAASGVAVVSGLARGIDGAVHRGALRAGGAAPIAVVGNGLDRPYPRQHTALWRDVAAAGVLISEWPPGTPPDAFRFPLRNRILAALSELLVVVESRERGGSLLTARAATDRSIDVMAVPGSPRNRAAAGTNRLLCDGAAPVTNADDVLIALGLDTRRCAAAPFDPRPTPVGLEIAVLARCRSDPCTLDDVVTELDLTVAEAAMALARLERSGWLIEAGGWFEAVETWMEPS